MRERLRIPRTNSKVGTTLGSEDLSGEFQSESEEPPINKIKMTLKPEETSGRYKVTSFFVITMNLECISMCRKKKHSIFALKYVDVTRSTQTDLDVMQDKRIDDCWNVDANRSLPASWKGFTKFTLLKEKPPK